MVWPRLKHIFRIPGGHGKKNEGGEGLVNVNEEYKEAFRTQSYIEICSKVEGYLQGRKITERLSSSSSLPLFVHLSESLLEPGQETLAHIIQGCNLHPLLVDYFKITTQASNMCEFFLQGICQTRANYRIIKRVIKLSNKTSKEMNYTDDDDDDQYTEMLRHLALYALKKNPLLGVSPLEFRQTQATRSDLLHQLTQQRRKIRWRIKLKKRVKKVVGCTVVVAYGAIAIALLVLGFHTIVGIVAAPALLTCSTGFFKKPTRLRNKLRASIGRVGAQLDVAAKGVYILINDFDTMSRLVRRLNDEIEHRRGMANMCVRNGKTEVLKEVVSEFRVEETSFLQQLEELEDHIYLCFLTINRSRTLVVEELMNGAAVML